MAKEQSINKRYLVLFPSGQEANIEDVDLISLPVEVINLISVTLTGEGKYTLPNFFKEMHRHGWIDVESSSDKGHFRFYPTGAMIFDLLREWLDSMSIEYFQAMSVRTPFLYQWNKSDIQGQAGMFHDQLYRVFDPASETEMVLRFNGDVGLFQIMRDSQLTYRHLPLRIYEFVTCFRYNQSGVLSGIRRARSFTFPDIHSFCTDLEQGLDEYEFLYHQQIKLANRVGIKIATLFKTTEAFLPRVRSRITRMAAASNIPVVIEIKPTQRQYWSMKHVGFTHHPQRLFHVQLDLEDGARYGVNYIDIAGEKKACTIIHSSIGSVEKWMLLVMENALKMETPQLPLWLSPVQVRLIPLGEDHFNHCDRLLHQITDRRIRVDIDDRIKKPLGKRIRRAEQEWIPYSLVIGGQELQSSVMSVRIRGQGLSEMSVEQLCQLINKQTHDFPYRPLPWSLVSRRLDYSNLG